MTYYYISLFSFFSNTYLYIQQYMFNYSLCHVVNRDIQFKAFVTRMNKYIIIIELHSYN